MSKNPEKTEGINTPLPTPLSEQKTKKLRWKKMTQKTTQKTWINVSYINQTFISATEVHSDETGFWVHIWVRKDAIVNTIKLDDKQEGVKMFEVQTQGKEVTILYVTSKIQLTGA